MSITTENYRIDIDLSGDLGAEVRPEAPDTATLEIEYGSGSRRTVIVQYGAEEWELTFEEGECVDRGSPARQPPKWLGDALEMVQGELR